jgi:radical SAM-linked protein
VQRVRLRYAKRGRLRFVSHRDFARAFERALRRADVPMAYSAGFSPHPRISYVGAAPTGAASEAEYVEIGLVRAVDVERLRRSLDDALPDGLHVTDAVVAGPGGLAERIEASHWRIELPGAAQAPVRAAAERFLARDRVLIERVTKAGRKEVDARSAVLRLDVSAVTAGPADGDRAILDLVVRQGTPAVRPDDVLAALRLVAGLALDAPPVAVRLAQGPLDASGAVGDPLAADRDLVEGAP